MLINAKEIATRIKVERNKLGYTQEELSEILSIGRVHLANIELGTKMASLDLLAAMCKAFDCSLDYLVLGSKSSNMVTKEFLERAIKPALGAKKLTALIPSDIQHFYNKLSQSGRAIPKIDKNGSIVKKDDKTVYEQVPLSAKSIKNIHGVLHKALQQAVELGYIRTNPTAPCKLPRIEKAEIKPLSHYPMA